MDYRLICELLADDSDWQPIEIPLSPEAITAALACGLARKVG